MATASTVICNVCLQWTNDPVTLLCGHNSCLKCLDTLTFLRYSSRCPSCQMDFEIIGGLKNLKINDQMDCGKQNGIKCDSCKENDSIKFCANCSYNYCSSCLVLHGSIPTSRDHIVEPVQSKSDIAVGQGDSFCKEQLHCLTLKHKNLTLLHSSEYDLDIKEKLLKKIILNHKCSENTICENELKASRLKKEIRQRGEDVKKAVDSIVAEFIENVDEELKQHQKEAENVLKELENLEINLKSHIEALKKQLNDSNYEIIPETSQIISTDEDIPTYSREFNCFFYSNTDEKLDDLKKHFGNIGRGMHVF